MIDGDRLQDRDCENEARLRLLSDDLTGLGNRFSLRDHLDRLVAMAPRSGPRPALLLLDLDGFENVNLLNGREGGDGMLRVTAGRLVRLVSWQALYRSGGDEFAILLDRATPEEAVAMAGLLLTAVAEPADVGDMHMQVTGSIGVVMLGDRHRADGVFRDADLAMHRAKAEGGNRVDIYSGELDYWALSRKRDLEAREREMEELRLENESLRESIMVDSATGLPNAAAFEADQLQVHARRSRSEEPYAVVLVDIDCFHDFKEHVRSVTAQQALRTLAQTIRDNVRQGDRAYRFGWQEFIVLLPGAGLRDAVVAAERIRSMIEDLAMDHPGSPSGVLTVTVAVVEAGFRHSNRKEVLAELSDVLLEGKQAGRNRVVWPH